MSNVPPPVPLNQVVGSAAPFPGTLQGISFELGAMTPYPALPAGPPPMQTAYGTVFPQMGGVARPWPTGAPAGRFGGVPGPATAVAQIPQLPPPPRALMPAAPPPPTAGVAPGPASAFPQRALPAAPTATTAARAAGVAPPPTFQSGAGILPRGVQVGPALRGGRLARLAGSRLGRAGIAVAGPTVADIAGDWIAERGFPGSGRVGAAAELGGAALAVTHNPYIAAGAAGLGAITGLELEDIPWVGGFFKEGEAVDVDELRERYSDILSQYGAPQTFVDQAVRQFETAYDVAGGDELDEEKADALAQDVLTGMIQHWQTQQAGGQFDPYAQAREELERARQYDLAQIAASQAWMQPLVTDVVNQQQQRADIYRDVGLGLAEQVTDPAVSAALAQLAYGYSSDQGVQNAAMLQQMAYTPDAMRAQLDAQFQDIMSSISLEEAQYQNEILASGGQLPGQPPIIGGIPLAPPGAPPPPVRNVLAPGTEVPSMPPPVEEYPAPPNAFPPNPDVVINPSPPTTIPPSGGGVPPVPLPPAPAAGPPTGTIPSQNFLDQPPTTLGGSPGAPQLPGLPSAPLDPASAQIAERARALPGTGTPPPLVSDWPFAPSSLTPTEPQSTTEWVDAAKAHEANGTADWFLRRNWGRLSHQDRLAISIALGRDINESAATNIPPNDQVRNPAGVLAGTLEPPRRRPR